MEEKEHHTNNNVDWKTRVFNSLSFPTLILRPDKTVVEANQIFLERFKVGRDAVVGKKCHEIFYQSSKPCLPETCPLARVLDTGKGASTLKRVLDEDRNVRWEDRVFSPILDENGEVAYILESVRDITRYKTMEHEVKVAKGFLEKVIESSASAILAADTKGKILLMNPSAEDLFGYQLPEWLDRDMVEKLYLPGEAKAIMRDLRDPNLGGRGKLPMRKTAIVNARGEKIPVEMTASIIYEDNAEMATMGIYNDLREKLEVEKKLEETRAQLAQSEKMASLGQLAAGVAHEINNPLGGILLYANLALEKLNPDHPVYEFLKYVIEDADRCKEIVKNLLVYSRQTMPDKKIIQINSLLEQSLSLIRDQAILRNIDVVRELSDEMMLVQVDSNQINQVIINLVMNAVDAMSGKGKLVFRTYRSKSDKKVYVEVSDSGCGIRSENMYPDFRPLFHHQGTGQGHGSRPEHRVWHYRREWRQNFGEIHGSPGHDVFSRIAALSGD